MNQFSKFSSERNLALLFPLLASEWHPIRNGDLKPTEVSIGSSKKVWWQCSRNHEWEAVIADRTRRNTKCPYCAHKKASKESNLTLDHPAIAAQWHPTKNASVKPTDVLFRSMFRAWWLCSKGHEWQSCVATRTDFRNGGPQCPFCSGKKVTSETSLATLFPAIAAQWHPTKNGNLTPNDVTAFSNRSSWWLCENNHEWETIIGSRTSKGITGCPYCSGRKPTPEYNLAICYSDIAKEFHPIKNGNLKATDVTPHSKQYFWWLCPKDHAYSMQVDARTTQNQNCPYCANMRVCADNCLAYLFPEIAKEWHPIRNGDLKPTEIVATSNKRVWWLCRKDKLHEWETKVDTRTVYGTGCPFCSNHRICLTNNLVYSYPDLAKEWDSERNGCTADEIVAGG